MSDITAATELEKQAELLYPILEAMCPLKKLRQIWLQERWVKEQLVLQN